MSGWNVERKFLAEFGRNGWEKIKDIEPTYDLNSPESIVDTDVIQKD